jgi:hypothetical protein
MKQICEACGKTIEKPDLAFRMKIELFADPTPPEFTREDLEIDVADEMRRLIEEFESINPREAEEEVYEAYLFTLCAACRHKMHDDLRKRQMPFEEHFQETD